MRTGEAGGVLVLSLGRDATSRRMPLEIPLPEHLVDFGVPSKVEIGRHTGQSQCRSNA